MSTGRNFADLLLSKLFRVKRKETGILSVSDGPGVGCEWGRPGEQAVKHGTVD